MVKLVSQEGESMEVDEQVACKSVLIKNMLDDTGGDDEIPLPNLRIHILKRIM